MSMLRRVQKGFDAIDPYGITIVVIDREMMLQLHRIIGVGNADSLLQTWFALTRIAYHEGDSYVNQ